MPHPDYDYQAAVLAACSGPSQSAPSCEGPAGTFVSKAHARLNHAIADVEEWARYTYIASPPMGAERLRHKTVLKEAARQQVVEAIADANDRLNAHNRESAGGTLDFYYSGHGHPNGDLCLADGPLSPDELADCWVRGNTSGRTRHVRLVLDCCHAGMTLARLYLHTGHWKSYVLRDAWVASLPGQEAFELPRLGHGVLTYTMLRPDPLRLSGGVHDEGEPTDHEIKQIRKTLRASTQYLTNGKQHSLDMINGHYVRVPGMSNAGIELVDRAWSLEELAAALDALPGHRPR